MQEAVTGHGGSVTYAEGCWVLEDKQLEQDMVNQYLGAYKPGQVIKPVHTRPNEQLVAEAVALARRSDVVVAALGELNNMNGEGVSRSDITLGLPQVELLKALKATGKPVILILTAGRPLALTETEPLADAILYTWSLGDQAGRAMADVVFGDVNPSARLSTSFPRNVVSALSTTTTRTRDVRIRMVQPILASTATISTASTGHSMLLGTD